MAEADKKEYVTLQPVALGNDYHADGVKVHLTDKQAEFLLASGTIKLANEEGTTIAAEPATAPARSYGRGAAKGAQE